jgi:hypothetical protein
LAFKKAPEAAMRAAGLSRAQRKLIKTRNSRLIAEAVAKEHPKGAVIPFILAIESIVKWWGPD